MSGGHTRVPSEASIKTSQKPTIVFPKSQWNPKGINPCVALTSEHLLACGHTIYSVPGIQPCGSNCMHIAKGIGKNPSRAMILAEQRPGFHCQACIEASIEVRIAKDRAKGTSVQEDDKKRAHLRTAYEEYRDTSLRAAVISSRTVAEPIEPTPDYSDTPGCNTKYTSNYRPSKDPVFDLNTPFVFPFPEAEKEFGEKVEALSEMRSLARSVMLDTEKYDASLMPTPKNGRLAIPITDFRGKWKDVAKTEKKVVTHSTQSTTREILKPKGKEHESFAEMASRIFLRDEPYDPKRMPTPPGGRSKIPKNDPRIPGLRITSERLATPAVIDDDDDEDNEIDLDELPPQAQLRLLDIAFGPHPEEGEHNEVVRGAPVPAAPISLSALYAQQAAPISLMALNAQQAAPEAQSRHQPRKRKRPAATSDHRSQLQKRKRPTAVVEDDEPETEDEEPIAARPAAKRRKTPSPTVPGADLETEDEKLVVTRPADRNRRTQSSTVSGAYADSDSDASAGAAQSPV